MFLSSKDDISGEISQVKHNYSKCLERNVVLVKLEEIPWICGP